MSVDARVSVSIVFFSSVVSAKNQNEKTIRLHFGKMTDNSIKDGVLENIEKKRCFRNESDGR